MTHIPNAGSIMQKVGPARKHFSVLASRPKAEIAEPSRGSRRDRSTIRLCYYTVNVSRIF